MARVKDAYDVYKRKAPSNDDDDDVFATPSWIAPRAKRSAMIRMQAGLQHIREAVAREATTDDEMEAFMNPAYDMCKKKKTSSNDDDETDEMEAFVNPTITTQPGAKNPIDDVSSIERSTTSSPSSPQPEDDGSDSTDDEMPVLFVLPDTTVIVSPHDTPAVFKPRTPNEDMTQEVCDVILEEVIGRKITLERQNSRLTLERATHNVCQDVAVTITSTDWQKGVRRHLQLESL